MRPTEPKQYMAWSTGGFYIPHKDREGQKSLAIFSGLMPEKVSKVRRLIFKLYLPQDIIIDLNPQNIPKKLNLQY